VIWTLGLITLLGMAVIVGARYRTKTSSNYASVTAAEMAAESAVNLAVATALAATPEQAVNFPFRCRLPGGERATITVEEETGKIDLNTRTFQAQVVILKQKTFLGITVGGPLTITLHGVFGPGPTGGPGLGAGGSDGGGR